MFAAHHKLDNLVVIVDANGFQAMGETRVVLDTEPLVEKMTAFGFLTRECKGNDLPLVEENIRKLVDSPSTQPRCLVARTVKGSGVSFMESENRWHYLRLDHDTLARALAELK